MLEKEKRIRELVRSYYIDNSKATEEMIAAASDKIVEKALEKQLSIEELKVILDDMHRRKRKLEEIRRNYYKLVQHTEEVAASIGNVPTKVVQDFLIEQEQDFEKLSSEQLIARAIEKFKSYRNQDIDVNHKVPQIIEKVLNSKELKEILTQILSNQSTAGEHNQLVLDGCYLSANLNKSNMVLSFVTDYIVIHQSDYDIEELYKKLQATDINSMSNKELNNFFTKTISESVQRRLGLEDSTTSVNKTKIAEYVYNNFIRNGYCYQGTNARFRDDIRNKGLSSEFSRSTNEDLVIVDKIFKKHGLNKIFYSKLSETAMSPYYYTTDSMNTAYFYSYHNPEYFAYFVASGNYMPDENYLRAAYYLRDHDECRNNLQKLCKKYLLSSEEQITVMSIFEKLSSEFMSEGPNTVTMVSRQLLNKHQVPVNLSDIETRSIESIIGEIMKSCELSAGTKQHLPIPADKVDIISVPTLSEFYDKEKMNRETVKKFIPLKNGGRYYYDVLIHADAIDYDCISIKDCIPSLTSIDSKDSNNRGQGKIDIITCPQDINQDTILSNGKPSFQSLQMMIAVNGKANSPEGKKLIADARKNYSPQYMSDYYYHLCELCCRIAEEKTIDRTKRCQAILRMAKDFFPKAELMSITGSYPEIVNEDRHLYDYLLYQELLQVKEVENLRNGYETTVDNDPLEYCVEMFKQKLEGKLNPEFSSEFDKKMKQYGITQLIENYNNQKSQIEETVQTEYQHPQSQNSSNELNSMFENSSDQNIELLSNDLSKTSPQQHETANKPKVMQLTQTSTNPSLNSTTNDGGISNSIVLAIITVATIVVILFLVIFR